MVAMGIGAIGFVNLHIGTIEVTLRTSDTARYPGFTATVVCVSSQLLGKDRPKLTDQITSKRMVPSDNDCMAFSTS